VRLGVATALATCLAIRPAWGHTFPPLRSVVVQVEPCEVALLVGYRPGTGEATEAIASRVATAPRSQVLDALRDLLTAHGMAPLSVSVDGRVLRPSSLRAKVGIEPGDARPMIVVLVTYPLPPGKSLAIASTDPRSTRISWQDRASGRVVISEAPVEARWHAGVASFLLKLSPAPGGQVCAAFRSSPSDSSASAR
jgi:hypothetical protein